MKLTTTQTLNRRTLFLPLAALALLALPTLANAQNLITFETTPSGGRPVDNATLNNPYTLTGGGTVRFFFDANLNNTYDPGVDILPVFEATGNDGTDGFVSAQLNTYDTARPGFEGQLGNFFLRQPDGIGPVPAPFVIAYNTSQTIRAFSGEIWDIDGANTGTEQWRVDVLNGSGAVLATLTSPLGVNADVDSLDSLPWNFGFTDLPNGVQAIRLTFIGSKTDGVGLAFNNFSPTVAVTVPEPGAVALLTGAAFCAGGVFLRRRRKLSR